MMSDMQHRIMITSLRIVKPTLKAAGDILSGNCTLYLVIKNDRKLVLREG